MLIVFLNLYEVIEDFKEIVNLNTENTLLTDTSK